MVGLWKTTRSRATLSSPRLRVHSLLTKTRSRAIVAGRVSNPKGKRGHISLRSRATRRVVSSGATGARSRRNKASQIAGTVVAMNCTSSSELKSSRMEDDESTMASPTDRCIPMPSPSPERPMEQPPQKIAKAPAKDEDLVKGFTAALMQMAALAPEDRRVTPFHAARVPSISIRDYLARIERFFGCSGSCYVLGLIYIDRLIKRHPDITISPLSVHRLLLTSMMVAAKFHDDVFYSNTFYSKIGGLRVQDTNALEAHFLKLLDWKLQVQPEEFDIYCNLCQAAAQGA